MNKTIYIELSCGHCKSEFELGINLKAPLNTKIYCFSCGLSHRITIHNPRVIGREEQECDLRDELGLHKAINDSLVRELKACKFNAQAPHDSNWKGVVARINKALIKTKEI